MPPHPPRVRVHVFDKILCDDPVVAAVRPCLLSKDSVHVGAAPRVVHHLRPFLHRGGGTVVGKARGARVAVVPSLRREEITDASKNIVEYSSVVVVIEIEVIILVVVVIPPEEILKQLQRIPERKPSRPLPLGVLPFPFLRLLLLLLLPLRILLVLPAPPALLFPPRLSLRQLGVVPNSTLGVRQHLVRFRYPRETRRRLLGTQFLPLRQSPVLVGMVHLRLSPVRLFDLRRCRARVLQAQNFVVGGALPREQGMRQVRQERQEEDGEQHQDGQRERGRGRATGFFVDAHFSPASGRERKASAVGVRVAGGASHRVV
mmetsp:Transcript_35123/g.69230  ORF Transcript_35123/g.69230 Transcript_35123/m.69230 type:complete len:317 (-) Transcript_35123:57-1007(-)